MRKATVLFTDERCQINGRPQPELPILLDGGRNVVHSVSDWFRYQAVMLNHPPTTLRLWSDIMLSFWNYLIKERVNWKEVDDNLLMQWRNNQEIEKAVKRRTINQRLSTVFRFYWWAQSHGYVENLIADPEQSHHLVVPRISLAVKSIAAKSGVHVISRFKSPLLYRTTREPNLHTPTAKEATALHAVMSEISGPTVAERNTLMLSWAEEAGLRRKEFASLTISQIPDWEEIDGLIESDSCKDIELVVTKGGHHRIVEVVPDLLIRTRNYIDEDRLSLIRRFGQNQGGSYHGPAAVFLSEKTGKAITFRAITNLFRESFQKAEVRGSGHRMRARYLTNLVQHYYDEAFAKHGNSISFDIVLLKAAEAAGHLHPSSLRPYLNLVRKRSLTTQDGEKFRYFKQRLLSVERDLNTKLARLETTTLLTGLAKAIRSGKNSSIKTAWSDLEADLHILVGADH